uniref:Uncharacterized protein n=1 Tax=Streptomyces sp. 31A4 TaxID=1415543 RepID=U5YPV2_9ACTN|nr:hypothetical protein [Streptomyces sp. 31A4]
MSSPENTPGAEPVPQEEQPDLAAVCAELQGELDALMQESGTATAARSLDTAVASLKEVEQRNVSSVQLVALADR